MDSKDNQYSKKNHFGKSPHFSAFFSIENSTKKSNFRDKSSKKRRKSVQTCKLNPLSSQKLQSSDAKPKFNSLLFYTNISCMEFRKKIEFTGWNITDDDLQNLSQLFLSKKLNNRSPKELILQYCNDISNKGLEYLCSIRSLRVLDLSGIQMISDESLQILNPFLTRLILNECSNVSDHGIDILSNQCPRLEVLSLINCNKLTNHGLSFLSKYHHLHSLNVSKCFLIDDYGAFNIISMCKQLLSLELKDLPLVTGITFYGFEHSTNSLRIINLSSSNIDPYAVNTIAKYCLQIEKLYLNYCEQINDENLEFIGRYAKKLQTLHLKNCYQITNYGVTELLGETTTTKSQLKDLVFQGCFLITDMSLSLVMERCPFLTSLNLSGLNHIKDSMYVSLKEYCTPLEIFKLESQRINSKKKSFYSSPILSPTSFICLSSIGKSLKVIHFSHIKCEAHHLACFLKHCPHLIDLNVSSLFTDEICSSLATSCHKLEILNISQSFNFDESLLINIFFNCRHLTTLNMQRCMNLTNDCLYLLASSKLDIKELHLEGNWQLTDQGILALLDKCMKLQCITVEYCPDITKECMEKLQKKQLIYSNLIGKSLFLQFPSVYSYSEAYLKESFSVFLIQRWYLSTKKRYKRYLEKMNSIRTAILAYRHAAIVIQCSFRCFKAKMVRKNLNNRRIQLLLKQQSTLAIILQRFYRGNRDRKTFTSKLRKEYKLEKEKRETLKKLERIREAKETIQKTCWNYNRKKILKANELIRIEREKKEFLGALSFQRLFRGKKGRKHSSLLRERYIQSFITQSQIYEQNLQASLHLQRYIRGFLARKKLEKRKEIENYKNKMARTIQFFFRSYLQKQKIKKRIPLSILRIQKVYRGYQSRLYVKKFLYKEKYILSMPILLNLTESIFTRNFAQKCNFKRISAAKIATFYQKWFRGWKGRCLYKEKVKEKIRNEIKRQESASIIQFYWKAYRLDLYRKKLHEFIRKKTLAATKISSIWRMRQGKVKALSKRYFLNNCQYYQLLEEHCKTKESYEKFCLLKEGAIYCLVRWYRNSLKRRFWYSSSEQERRTKAAFRLQAFFKGQKTRKEVKLYKEICFCAIKKIKHCWFKMKERKMWKEMLRRSKLSLQKKEEVNRAKLIALQTISNLSKQRQEQQEKSIIVLQRFYRSLAAKHFYKNKYKRIEEKRKLNAQEEILFYLNHEKKKKSFEMEIRLSLIDNKGIITDEEYSKYQNEKQEEIQFFLLAKLRYEQLQMLQYDKKRCKKAAQIQVKRCTKEVNDLNETFNSFLEENVETQISLVQLTREKKSLEREITRISKLLKVFQESMHQRFLLDSVIMIQEEKEILDKLQHWSPISLPFQKIIEEKY